MDKYIPTKHFARDGLSIQHAVENMGVNMAKKLDFEICYELFGERLFTDEEPEVPVEVSVWYLTKWITEEEMTDEDQEIIDCANNCRERWSRKFKIAYMEARLGEKK